MHPKYLNSKTQQIDYPKSCFAPSINLAQVFEPRRNSYLNELTLFTNFQI
jgi:hypothetical protein